MEKQTNIRIVILNYINDILTFKYRVYLDHQVLERVVFCIDIYTMNFY